MKYIFMYMEFVFLFIYLYIFFTENNNPLTILHQIILIHYMKTLSGLIEKQYINLEEEGLSGIMENPEQMTYFL